MAEEISCLVGPSATVGLERLNAGVAIELNSKGIRVVDAQYAVELTRSVKSADSHRAKRRLRRSQAPERRAANKSLVPGNERKHYRSQRADLDTDVVGCYGCYSDFSRTFHSGPETPAKDQRELYKIAYEQLHHSMSILRPHMHFRDYAREAWDISEKYYANRYYLSAHGCGMTGEYPYLYHEGDLPAAGYDGEIVPGMTVCVDSYIGLEGGTEGVKLEEQVLITDTGIEVLSRFPFEEQLLR